MQDLKSEEKAIVPVPSVVVFKRAFFIVWQVLSLNTLIPLVRIFGESAPFLSAVPLIKYGSLYTPLFAIVAKSAAICNGVAVNLPCPKAKLPTAASLLSSEISGRIPSSVK